MATAGLSAEGCGGLALVDLLATVAQLLDADPFIGGRRVSAEAYEVARHPPRRLAVEKLFDLVLALLPCVVDRAWWL